MRNLSHSAALEEESFLQCSDTQQQQTALKSRSF